MGGGCAVVGDDLYIYARGPKGNAPHFHDAGGSTGLATLRRDGFASMDAGADEGVLVTRPVRFNGRHLFVNVDCDSGELLTEILGEDGDVIALFSREHCERIQADKTICQVRWAGVRDLSELAGKTVRFRFHLRQGRLYGFWVSPDESGASHGYVAAGGPGFTGPTDTVGSAAYSQ